MNTLADSAVHKARGWSSLPANAAPARLASEVNRSFTGFLRAVCQGDRATLLKVYGSEYATSSQVRKAAMGELSGTVGGYLVPTDFTFQIMSDIAEESFIFPRATIIPMTSMETRAPGVDEGAVAAAMGVAPFFGGMRFKWGASQAPAETEPIYKSLMLHAWDLLGYLTMSNQFLMDIGDEGEEYLLRLVARAAAWYSEFAFLQGQGAAQLMPLGILNAPATKTVTRAGAGTIAVADIANMGGTMLPYGWKNAIWACSPTAFAKVSTLSTFFINADESVRNDGHAGCLLSRPLFITDKLPPVGAKGDLIFFDPSLYIIGDRMEVRVDVSMMGPAFQTNQTDLRVWLRLDGKPQVDGPITLQDQSTIVSPYIALL